MEELEECLGGNRAKFMQVSYMDGPEALPLQSSFIMSIHTLFAEVHAAPEKTGPARCLDM